MTKLNVQSTDIIHDRGADFSLLIPKDLSEESYRVIRQNIEFRRKCMNQGFDNLLELLEMHWNVIKNKQEKQPCHPASPASS